MIDELGMMEDERNPLVNGLVTFISFLFAGAVPLLVYLLSLIVPIPAASAFTVSLIMSGFALFGLGLPRAWLPG